MTISSTTTEVIYTGDGSTTAFPTTFPFFGTSTSAELTVIERVIATGAETTKSNGTDFTVSGGSGTTGTVTAAVAPANTVKWLIKRNTTKTQETDYVENDPFPAESHEDALDRLTLIAQEAAADGDKAFKYSDTYSGGASTTVPDPSAGKALKWNAGGTALENSTYDPDEQATLAAASAAAASASETSAAASATLASQWATKTDGQVASTDYSSKAWAIGGTGVTDTASAGAAKEWATAAEDDLVDGSEYSAKHYSAKASGFATNAEASATNAAASEAAAAAAAQGWADVVSITAGTTNIEITDANKYYILDASGGSITMNLPAVGTSDGLTLAFEVLDASNSITIARDGTDTINGSAADYTGLTAVGDVVHFISIDGTPDNWSARLISRFVVDGTTITQSGRTISTSRASASEVNTGTDTNKAVTPDALAGSNYGTAVVPILVFDDATDCATGDGAGDLFFRIPSVLNGFDLVAVAACCQTAGTTGTMDIQVHNVTQAADMLSTKITIDSGETDSSTAATPAVIDTNNDDVATGDQIRIDVDAVHSGTAAKGLLVELQFRLP